MKRFNWISFVLTFVMSVGISTATAAGLPPPQSPKEWKKSADGYYFEKPTFVREEFPVRIVLVKSYDEMLERVNEQGGRFVGTIKPKEIAAFSVIKSEDKTCTIYMIDPKVQYRPELIGHELTHCIYGFWHSEPQK